MNLHDWKPVSVPDLGLVEGRFVRVSRYESAQDCKALFAAICGEDNDDLWDYIPFGPLSSIEELDAILKMLAESRGFYTHVLRDVVSNEVLGMASYMRVRPEAGSVEVGCIIFSKKLQKTPAASEAMYLMARYLFEELGYRRYEWKCDSANAGSQKAALRLGFTAEGMFRQDLVVKGRNRDTCWFSMLDIEWPKIKQAFELWLAEDNFDEQQQQRKSLTNIRAPLAE